MILGALAHATDDPEERQRCLDEGMDILAAGAPAHNHIYFALEAIEVALEAHDWPGALRYAGLLELQFRDEPIQFADFLTARAHALCAIGQGRRDAGCRAEVERLVAVGREHGYTLLLRALEAAATIPGWEQEVSA
jgi:hypothetical protein